MTESLYKIQETYKHDGVCVLNTGDLQTNYFYCCVFWVSGQTFVFISEIFLK